MTTDQTIWEGRPSQAMNTSTYAFGAIGTVAMLVMGLYNPLFLLAAAIPLLFMAYSALLTRSQNYVLTVERLITTYGVIARNTDQLELYRVKDYQVRQDILQRMFNKGDVIIATSDKSHPVVILQWVDNATQVAKILRPVVEDLRIRRGVREFD